MPSGPSAALRLILAVALAGLVSACAGSGPLAPPLPTPGAVVRLPPIAESAIIVRATADYAAMTAAANNAVPARVVDLNDVDVGLGGRFGLAVTRSNILVSQVDGGVGFTSAVRVEGRLEGRCLLVTPCLGALRAEGQVWGMAQPALNPDWTIRLTASGRYQIEDADLRLPLVPGSISVRAPLSQALQSPFYALVGQISREVSRSVVLKSAAATAWTELGRPIPISASPPVWLMVNPVKVLSEQPAITDRGIELGAALVARPEVIIGDRPADHETGPLPDLTIVPRLPDQFSLYLPVRLTYADATELADQGLAGRTLPAGGGVTVSVDHVSIFSNGDEVGVRLAFHARAGDGGWRPSGVVYLLGKPVYHLQDGYISVENLHFDIKTHDALLKLASWMEHQAFIDDLQARLHFDVREQAAARRSDLDKAIAAIPLGAHLALRGQVTSLAPSAVYLMRDGLQVNLVVLGTLAVAAS